MSRFVDTLLATAAGRGTRVGITTGEPHEPEWRTWAEVHEQARCMAGSLVAGDVSRGDAVAVLAGEPKLIAPAVQAVWLAGGSVTMLHQPTPRTDLAEWAQDTIRVLRMIGSHLVLLGEPFDQLAGVLDEHGIGYRMISSLADGERLERVAESAEDEPALLQLTSGSTAEPKAVKITHGNLIANMTAMADDSGLDLDDDLMVSWLPVFHDMGMVGFLTLPMTFGVELVKITPTEFLSGPLVWPELMSRYRATITAAPNFAYAIVGRRMSKVDDDNAYDLSRLRIALNGAEPIDESAVRAFTDAGARFGMPAECVFPAFGMAEVTLAVSFAPVFTGLTTDVVEAEALEAENRAVPIPEGDPRRETEQARSFAMLGRPLAGIETEIVNEQGERLGEREVGEIRLRGSSVTPGYLTVNGPVPTQDEQGWLNTGDLGYLVDGQIVICGRSKDVIIMGGRNIYPTDVERAAGAVKEVRAGNAVAVRIDAGSRRERFAVVLESSVAGDSEAERALANEVTSRVVDAVGVRPVSVVVLDPGTLPKTPSGKLRRAAAGERFAERIGEN